MGGALERAEGKSGQDALLRHVKSSKNKFNFKKGGAFSQKRGLLDTLNDIQ